MSTPITFKLVLIGDGATGKSIFTRQQLTGDFEPKYVATLGVEVHPLLFRTNKGSIVFNVWDCAGVEKFGGLRDGYYINGQCGIVMFDLSNPHTLKNVPLWIRDLREMCGDIPLRIVGNKADVEGDKVDASNNAFYAKLEAKYGPILRISSKTREGIDTPFLELAKQLVAEDVAFNPTN